jgi:DNA-binding response OmpR family regulator
VLVVEDNDEMRAFLEEKLSALWNVVSAPNGHDAWALVQESPPDLVLSDIMMPGLDGIDLCRRIKADEELRAVPVVLLTARATTDDAVEGLDAGADDYIEKPFDVEELRQRLRSHLAAREHLRSRYRREVRLTSMEAVVDEEHVPFIERLDDAVAEHLDNPDFTVDRLAAEMALSRRQLTRRMKEAVDETPASYIRQRRLDHAEALLGRNPQTIAEVAYAVGFRSPSAFSKAFREHAGCTPTEYVDANASS